MADRPHPSPISLDIPLWQYIAAVAIPAIPFVIVFIRWSGLPNVATAPSFSDSVELVNAFLSAAAFSGVLLTLLLQRRDLNNQALEFQQSMQMQALATYLSVVDSRREILATKPLLDDAADVRTLHQSLAVFQLGKYLDRVETMLQRSASLELDEEVERVNQQSETARALIARIAVFDLVRRSWTAHELGDEAFASLREWFESTLVTPQIPAGVRTELQSLQVVLETQLTALQQIRADRRPLENLAPIQLLLADIRKVLVRGVRTHLFTISKESSPSAV